ncbi:MAG: 2Fe-2S ferredoxin, partial [Planctomycetota bacterium]
LMPKHELRGLALDEGRGHWILGNLAARGHHAAAEQRLVLIARRSGAVSQTRSVHELTARQPERTQGVCGRICHCVERIMTARRESRGIERNMHLKRDDSHHHGPPVIPVTFILEDPEGLTGTAQKEWHVLGGEHESLLEVAIDNGINIEHACGGVCACSTCHVYVEQGAAQMNEASEDEEDRVEEAPGIKRTSRLSCQCELKDLGEGKRVPIVVRVPAWNRNAVKEIPH